MHGLSDSTENAEPPKVLVQVGFGSDLKAALHVVHDLMHSFNHAVGLWVASGDELALNPALVLEGIAHFSGEFFSPIHDCLGRPEMLG